MEELVEILTPTVQLTGALQAAVQLTGTLQATVQLTGTLQATVQLTGTLIQGTGEIEYATEKDIIDIFKGE